MRNCETILIILLFFARPCLVQAQSIERYNTFSYSVNEGLLQSTINELAIDKNNFCWISFPNGIQKFDGKNFTLIPVQPGLPDDKQAHLFRCHNGDLLISHSYGISKYEISNDRFSLVYSYPLLQKKAAQFIGEDEGIVYFFSDAGNITGISTRSLIMVSEIKGAFPYFTSNNTYLVKFSSNIINHKVAVNINSVLYLWDLRKKKVLQQSAPVRHIALNFLRLKTENEVLYYDYKMPNALQLYNYTAATKTPLFVKGKDDKLVYSNTIFHWQDKILLCFGNRIYEVDSTLQVLKNELVNFQNQPVAGNQAIVSVTEDNFSNLYLQTVKGGIKKIIRNNYPFKYYSTGKPDSSYIITILPDKRNNRVLAGTAENGLLVFDTLQRLVKHIKTLPGRTGTFNVNTILKTNKGSYLLFIGNDKQVWELSHDFSQLKSITISSTLPDNKEGTNYFGNFLFQNEQEALVQSQSNIYQVDFAANTVTEHRATEGYTMSGILYNQDIITHANDELIFMDAATFNVSKRIPFKNTGGVRCFTKDNAGNIYIGSNKGIFKIDSNGAIIQHLTKEKGLPDDCIYAMSFDENGFLWCSSNKGIIKIKKDNSLQQFKKEDGLQENEFNTNAVAKAADGELFFGGVNGLSSFYPAAISNFEEKINLLFTKIKVNNEEVFKDTAVWNITKIDLPYNQNSLSFDFIAMANNNPSQYSYQYKMEGVDEHWIENDGMQTVRYFLPPGNYFFKIYASRFFNKDAKAMQQIRIIINPPFWKTWWFIASIALLLLASTAFVIYRYSRLQYQRKLQVLENDHKIQLERERISRDLHDSIGAYANAVLYNTELLQQSEALDERRGLMDDLKFASKDIITSLRETVWALKKENYSAEDCLIRIKNFIQPLARYYQHINFKVEGHAPNARTLHYTKALNVVRIIQEAVTNSIKHGEAKNIVVSSSELNGRWHLNITDDGKSFDYDQVSKADSGNGLKNMKKRAADSGFDFNVNPFEGGSGTTICILV